MSLVVPRRKGMLFYHRSHRDQRYHMLVYTPFGQLCELMHNLFRPGSSGGSALPDEQSDDFYSSPPWERCPSSPPSSPEMPSPFLKRKRSVNRCVFSLYL